jgi:hypothetical protein
VSGPVDSGFLVIEAPGGEEPIPPQREVITAFVGPAPRGPVHHPVEVRSVSDYLKVFGAPAAPCVMGGLLMQYFACGGSVAVVVRVAGSAAYNRLQLPGPGGPLALVAANPGALECLRVTVDHDGIEAGDSSRFNLVVQRLQGRERPLVEAQEIHAAVSVDPDDERFLGEVLSRSALLRLEGDAPAMRPEATGLKASGEVVYAWSQSERPEAGYISDYDLIGSPADGFGLHALDLLPVVDQLCLLPGRPHTDIGPVALFAAERYCRKRHALLLVDPPLHWQEPRDALRSQRERGFASADTLSYFPRLDPASADVAVRAAQGSALGALAGWLARCLREGNAAAARPLRLRARPRFELESFEVGALARAGINSLVLEGAGQLAVKGLVTLAGTGAQPRLWQALLMRGRALRLLGDLARGTRWLAHDQGGADSWNALKQQLSTYLEAARQAGQLVGEHPELAWQLECGADRDGGPHSFIVGLALRNPGEFVAFRFRQAAEGCEISETGWQPGLALVG